MKTKRLYVDQPFARSLWAETKIQVSHGVTASVHSYNISVDIMYNAGQDFQEYICEWVAFFSDP